MAKATEKFAVRNRWTNRVQFEATIVCAPDASIGIKLGLAVRWGRNNGAVLSDADLSGADLRGAALSDAALRDADLRGADLRGAALSDAALRDADLRGAVLRGAALRSFKADFFLNLLRARNEVPYLIAALKEGRVDGSQYEGECACLVGTLANARGASYAEMFPDHYSGNPAEQWFLMIKKGDKPGDDTGGGFAAQKALEWAEEFQALMSDPVGESA